MNIIAHNFTHVLPDGFTVRDGYMSFRLAGQIWHTSGWTNPESGSIFCYSKRGSQFIGEWLDPDGYAVATPDGDWVDREWDPEDEAVLLEVIRRADDYIPEVQPEKSGIRITPCLALVIGRVFGDPDRIVSIPTADDRAGNEENTNGGAYVCRAQFQRWCGTWWACERWSCDGDIRDIPDWTPVSDGTFIRLLAAALAANSELEDDLQWEAAEELFGELFPGRWIAAWNRYKFLSWAFDMARRAEGGGNNAA